MSLYFMSSKYETNGESVFGIQRMAECKISPINNIQEPSEMFYLKKKNISARKTKHIWIIKANINLKMVDLNRSY